MWMLCEAMCTIPKENSTWYNYSAFGTASASMFQTLFTNKSENDQAPFLPSKGLKKYKNHIKCPKNKISWK